MTVRPLAWSQDGRYLVLFDDSANFERGTTRPQVWDVQTNQPAPGITDFAAYRALDPVWSPGGPARSSRRT